MGKRRKKEHQAFFIWLFELIEKEDITLLIVAGDIFDTGTPPNYALELYYDFLTKLSQSSCSNIIITAGNHDSIATLKAPKQLLKAVNIHLIASGDRDEEEVIPIYEQDRLQAIICAVPFLRDYVVRKSVKSETMDAQESALTQGIKEHYKSVYYDAMQIAKKDTIPIIATGHLTTVGAKRSESEREIYVGASVAIGSEFLSEKFDYVALGHLHSNQKVDYENVRYSGSPIPLSFAESLSQKKVNIVTFLGKTPTVREVAIPLYRPLLVFRGKRDTILKKLEAVTNRESWIEAYVEDDNPFYANQVIRERAKDLDLTLLAVKIEKNKEKLQKNDFKVIGLDELTPLDLFEKRLEKEVLQDEVLQKELISNFKNILAEVENL